MPACGPCQVGNCENHYNQPLWEEECDDYSKSSEGHSAKKYYKNKTGKEETNEENYKMMCVNKKSILNV